MGSPCFACMSQIRTSNSLLSDSVWGECKYGFVSRLRIASRTQRIGSLPNTDLTCSPSGTYRICSPSRSPRTGNILAQRTWRASSTRMRGSALRTQRLRRQTSHMESIRHTPHRQVIPHAAQRQHVEDVASHPHPHQHPVFHVHGHRSHCGSRALEITVASLAHGRIAARTLA